MSELTDPMKQPEWPSMSRDERLSALREYCLCQPGAVPLNAGTFPDPNGPEREWRFVTYLSWYVWLVVQCQRTGAWGVVKEPTAEEWSPAPDWQYDPQPWPEYWRVTLLPRSPMDYWKGGRQ